MYSSYGLDTPPPRSQFAGHGLQKPYDPLPSSSQIPVGHYDIQQQDYHARPQRREASDVSVEALDLADYAYTLRGQPHPQLQPYGQPWRAYDAYPPEPQPIRPLATGDSLATPSLTSASSQSHGYSVRTPHRRPFSLPPPSSSRSYNSYGAHAPPYPPAQAHFDQRANDAEIAQFPPWSRGWYDGGPRPHYGRLSAASADPHSSFFDPAYTSPSSKRGAYTDPYAGTVDSHGSTGNLLPWGNDHDYGPEIGDEIKEERMRMLEREFGGKGVGNPKEAADEEEHLVGSVDSKGNLITQGPKKRMSVRLLETALSLGAAISGIYGALVIKPKLTPPPQGSIASYLLYILSVVTFLALFYIFALRPCCFRSSKRVPVGAGAGPGGMMVLPVNQLPGGSKAGKKKGKKGKKGQDAGQGVQVNLIVDPGMFNQGREEESEEEEEGGMPGGTRDEWGSAYGSSSASGAGKRKSRKPKRRSVFAGLAMEEQWRAARKVLKRMMWFDMAMLVLWGAEFVYVLIGKRCPAGGFEGWCNAYNTATAAACLLAFAFGVSIFFDVKDLHQSKASPRTRT